MKLLKIIIMGNIVLIMIIIISYIFICYVLYTIYILLWIMINEHSTYFSFLVNNMRKSQDYFFRRCWKNTGLFFLTAISYQGIEWNTIILPECFQSDFFLTFICPYITKLIGIQEISLFWLINSTVPSPKIIMLGSVVHWVKNSLSSSNQPSFDLFYWCNYFIKSLPGP